MLDRRLFLGLFSALLGCSAAPKMLLAAANGEGWTAPSGSPGQALRELTTRASGPDTPRPRSAIPSVDSDDYDVILPQLVDLIASIEQRSRMRGPATGGLDTTLKDATELLGALTSAERSPAVEGEPRAIAYAYEQLRDGYLTHYDQCKVRPERASLVDWHIGTLMKPENRSRYEDVGKRLQIPWYFVGIIHSLEAGFNFGGHLHNGDPLKARTWQVPAGRPLQWNPPTDWSASAADALAMKNYNNQSDWTLGQILYRFEKYNGFGYRRRAIETPYLWSFSNQYGKGKYVKDGVWDANAVSRQCGAGLLVKELVSRGAIAAPARA